MAGQRLPAWVVAPPASRVLASLWNESLAARQERVGCLGGRITADTVYVDSARALPTATVDSITADGRPSIEGCGLPLWFGSVHTHVRSTDDPTPVGRFSPGDRTVMSLWVERWGRRGGFCVLHSAHAAHCELYPPQLGHLDGSQH
jgi:hypothetical protein